MTNDFLDFLNYVQRTLYGKCTTVLTYFDNGSVSFGVYSKYSPKIWVIDKDHDIAAIVEDIKTSFGLK